MSTPIFHENLHYLSMKFGNREMNKSSKDLSLHSDLGKFAFWIL
uniref:Uncharacterized protein n=1 Tax=Setaria italica TaxID=4555 RepID=K4A446_SETIT